MRRGRDPDRLPCEVPFCGRTTPARRLAEKGHDEWICGTHWRLVDPTLKALKRRVERKLVCQGDAAPPRLRVIAWRIWQEAKQQAIGNAGDVLPVRRRSRSPAGDGRRERKRAAGPVERPFG